MTLEETEEDKYSKAKAEREEHINNVLNSPSQKKVIVAGPGTGKTHLFKEVLKDKTETLTLTFVSSLVEDLSLELYGLSDVKTLHSFARSELSRVTKNSVKVFSWLPTIIKEDAKILQNEEIDFDTIFHSRDDNNVNIQFYKKRKDYYGSYYGFTDIIFAIVKYYEVNKDKIPSYKQVIVDEFQDFNKVEVDLIDLLAEKSPVLVAGDDDQALYTFKGASPEHLRARHGNDYPDYTSFNLPLCSRSTEVIVNAVNDFISNAKSKNLLSNRVEKHYRYFIDKDKDKEGELNPTIDYAQVFAKKIPWFIQQELGLMATQVRKKFSVLIITPTKLQSKLIRNALNKKGFQNIPFVEKKDENGPSLLDGLRILLEDPKSNLGWRVIAKRMLSDTQFTEIINKSSQDEPKQILDYLLPKTKKEVRAALSTLRAVSKDKAVTEEKLNVLLKLIGHNTVDVLKSSINTELHSLSPQPRLPGLQGITINITTVEKSKGLAADVVFITFFDDQYYIKNKNKQVISDQDICKFIVAMTRARKKLYLVSSSVSKRPTFLGWIDSSRIKKC